ncbi:MAG: hypothetical protein ACRD29_16390 [Acidimicrobiales bacterium]
MSPSRKPGEKSGAAREAVRERMAADYARLNELEERRTAALAEAWAAQENLTAAEQNLVDARQRMGKALNAVAAAGYTVEVASELLDIPAPELQRLKRQLAASAGHQRKSEPAKSAKTDGSGARRETGPGS